MRKPLCLTATALFAFLGLSQSATADLILDGTFKTLTNQAGDPTTYTYGQWGTADPNNAVTKNNVIKIANWDTAGYNFVFSGATAAAGTQTNGANTGIANQAPGQYNNSAGYGTTYLYGSGNGTTNSGNGGLKDFTPNPTTQFTGNFIAADGAFETAAISQTVNGLVAGKVYQLTFWWGGAQEQGTGFIQPTTEKWTVSLGSQSFTTNTVSVANKDFSGWMKQTFNYTATSTSEVLSFLAGGTPDGQPPFVLLGGVSMIQVPEPSTWAALLSLVGGAWGGRIIRRRRNACQAEAAQA